MTTTFKNIALFLFLIVFGHLSAQEDYDTNGSQSIGVAISTSVNVVTTGSPTLAVFATESDIETGETSAAVTFAVKANRTWKVSTAITGITSVVIDGGPASITEPLTPAHISWGVADGSGSTASSFTPFSPTVNTSTEIKAGPKGAAAVTGNTFSLQYKVIPGYLVDPGTYAIAVTHTITAY